MYMSVSNHNLQYQLVLPSRCQSCSVFSKCIMKTRTRRKSKQKHKSENDTNCALCPVVIVASAMLREHFAGAHFYV